MDNVSNNFAALNLYSKENLITIVVAKLLSSAQNLYYDRGSKLRQASMNPS